MISTASPFEKRIKNPLYYLWTKWNQPTNDEKEQNNTMAMISNHVFGAPLEQVIQYTDHGLVVPITVQLCFAEIIKRGLETEGLFRLSGATSEVIQLQKAFEQQGEQQVDLANYDIHSITSFIKKYLHHLPIAVIPAENHDDFLRLSALTKDQAIPMLSDLINELPDQHRHLFHAILSLASHIQQYAHTNMMNPEALAVVLAPVCTGIEKTIQVRSKKTSKRNKKQLVDQGQQYTHQQQQYGYHYHPCINTHDIEQFIRTNARWTLLWKWMIEDSDTILLSTTSTQTTTPCSKSLCRSLDDDSTWSLLNAHKDTITSIVGSPAPPPPVPSLLYWSSSLAAAKDNMIPSAITTGPTQHHSSSSTLYSNYIIAPSTASLASEYQHSSSHSHFFYNKKTPSSKANLKSRPSSPSMFSLCQKQSHGILRRLASVSSLR